MFCHKCGNQAIEDATFCEKCGAKLIKDDCLDTSNIYSSETVQTTNNSVSTKMVSYSAYIIKLIKFIWPFLIVIIGLVFIFSGKLKNTIDMLEKINSEIEVNAADATVVPNFQSADDLFPDTSDNDKSSQNTSESSFAWIEEPTIMTDYEGFEFRYIVGAIQNVSDITFPYTSIEFALYDAYGNQIGTTIDSIQYFEAGNTWRFKAMILEDEAVTFKFLHATKSIPDN